MNILDESKTEIDNLFGKYTMSEIPEMLFEVDKVMEDFFGKVLKEFQTFQDKL